MRISRECRAPARRPGGRSGAVALVIALAALIAALLTLGTSGDARGASRPADADSTSVESGKPAPDFAYDVGRGPKKLSDTHGVPVLIHFWDSWCGPCVDELPLLARAHKEDPAMAIITVSDEDPGVARKYIKEQGFDLPVSEDTEHKIFRLYGVHAIPVSIFVQADGNVGHVSVGEMEWPEIAEAMAGLRPR